MIHLSGLQPIDNENPDGDIEVNFTGLRPGEKLYEELLIGDNVIQSKHPRIMQAREEKLSLEKVEEFIEATPQEFIDSLRDIIKYNKSSKGFNQLELEKIRKVFLSWKRFLEEYKWKSNYISVKIKKLLCDTEVIISEDDSSRDI